MRTIIATLGGITAIVATVLLSAPAHAGAQDDVLCSSNGAYRTAHPTVCADIGWGSHGGGGGWNDADGDLVGDKRDSHPNDPSQH